MKYSVIVGNIGHVYDGNSHNSAAVCYYGYVSQSKAGIGRAGGEDVALMKDGEPYLEHDATAWEIQKLEGENETRNEQIAQLRREIEEAEQKIEKLRDEQTD